MKIAQHRNFGLGMNQDEASFLLPEGYVYSSKNMLFDKLGVARKRGGITGLGSTTTYNGDQLGALTTDENTIRFYSKGVGGNVLTFVNTATGALVSMGGSNFGDLLLNGGGRPFQNYGTLIWPGFSINPGVPSVAPYAVAGADGTKTGHSFTVPGSVGVTAGDKQVACSATDSPLTYLQVGQFVSINNATNLYIGRVTRLVSTTAFEVYPTPTISLPSVSVATATMAMSASVNGGAFATIGSRIGMSYQGRVVLGNISRYDGLGAGRLEQFPRRVQFSSTLLEGDTGNTPALYDGMLWLMKNGYPAFNYFDIPGQDPLTAMSPTGFGDAVYFSPYRAFQQTGNLSTQYGLTQSITWAIREIPNSVGCLTERSLQRTPRGLLFAHDSGIYSTDGKSMQPILRNRVANIWRALVRGASFAIYGSALIRGNHYYICGTSAGSPFAMMVNLDTLAWGIYTGKAAAPASWLINSAAQDPSNPAVCWGLKWWDESGGAPSMTGGQLVKLDDMFAPSSANRADSDTQIVSFEIVTRPYTEDSQTGKKMWNGATVEYANFGGAAVTVRPGPFLDSANLPSGGIVYALPQQNAYVVTAASNASPIVITCGAHNLAQDSWVVVAGVSGNLNANGRFRVQSVTATTVTLMGSYGSGTYAGSGGTISSASTRDIPLTAMGDPNGSDYVGVVYRINDSDLGSPGADSFELYGITHDWDDTDTHDE